MSRGPPRGRISPEARSAQGNPVNVDVLVVGAGPAGLAGRDDVRATRPVRRARRRAAFARRAGLSRHRGRAARAKRHPRRGLSARRSARRRLRAQRGAIPAATPPSGRSRARKTASRSRSPSRRHAALAHARAHRDRDGRARAAVSRTRVDAARRHDGRRRAGAPQDLRHGRRRTASSSPATVRSCGSSHGNTCARARRRSRCSTRRRADASRRRCVTRPRSPRRRTSARDFRSCARCAAACPSSSTSTRSRSRATTPRSAVRYRVADRPATIDAAHVFLHQGVVPDINLAVGARLRDRVGRCERLLSPGRRRVGRHEHARRLHRGRRRRHCGCASGGDPRPPRGACAGQCARAPSGRRARSDRAARSSARLHMRCAAGVSSMRCTVPTTAFAFPRATPSLAAAKKCPPPRSPARHVKGAPAPTRRRATRDAAWDRARRRYCGLTVTEIVAHETSRSPADVGPLHARFPLKPVTLAEIASLPVSDDARSAVVR